MNLESIQSKFVDQAAKIMAKGGTAPSFNQLRGVNYYLTAAHNIQLLIDQGPIDGEEFVQREYVAQKFVPSETVLA